MSEPPVNFAVTICGIDELPEHCESGVSHVLSILDPGYPAPPAFGSFEPHARLELHFSDVIDERPGYQAPQPHHVEALLAFGRDAAATRPAHLLIHCHAGISRSTAAAALLLAQARPDLDENAILAEILRIRPRAWPNIRMVELGDRMLGRAGRLVAATRARHMAVAAASRDVAEAMIHAGRRREVEGR